MTLAGGEEGMSTQRLGLLGGVFDPPHNGHLACAELARNHLHLDPFFLVPAGDPPHKHGSVHACGAQRLAMLQLAMGNTPAFSIYTGELEHDGPSYTVDTVSEVARRYPHHELCFVMGSDNLAELPSWHRWRSLLDTVTLCVTLRPGYPLELPPGCEHCRVRTFPSPGWELSSTKLRGLIAAGHSCRYLIPDPVRNYIASHNLYRSAQGTPAAHPADYSNE